MLRRRTKLGPIGLDIGATGIRLLQFADAGGRPTLAAAAQYDLSESANNPEEREAAIRSAIADALRHRPFGGRDVVASLSHGEFQMKSLRLPKMPAEEMATAVQFEAQDRFDLAGRTVQIRHLPAGEVRHGNEIKEEVMVFAAGDELIAQRLSLLESLGLRPVALELAPCAVARSFIRFLRRVEDEKAVNVFVDVGWRGTSIIITHGPELTFLKTLEIGGQHFTEAVGKALTLSQKQALELRIRRMRHATGRGGMEGSALPAEIDSAATDAIRPLIDRMLRDIQLCLRYFAVTFRGQRPDCLTFVGGEASEPALTKIIADEIDIPCLIGNPLRGVVRARADSAPEGIGQRTIQPMWTVACGLALHQTAFALPSMRSPRASDATVKMAPART